MAKPSNHSSSAQFSKAFGQAYDGCTARRHRGDVNVVGKIGCHLRECTFSLSSSALASRSCRELLRFPNCIKHHSDQAKHCSGITSQRECRQGAGQPLVQVQESPGLHAAPGLSSRLCILSQALPLHLCKGERPLAWLLLYIKSSLATSRHQSARISGGVSEDQLAGQGSIPQLETSYSNARIKGCR